MPVVVVGGRGYPKEDELVGPQWASKSSTSRDKKVPVGRQAKNESQYLVETRIDMYATFHVVYHSKLVVFHNETDQK